MSSYARSHFHHHQSQAYTLVESLPIDMQTELQASIRRQYSRAGVPPRRASPPRKVTKARSSQNSPACERTWKSARPSPLAPFAVPSHARPVSLAAAHATQRPVSWHPATYVTPPSSCYAMSPAVSKPLDSFPSFETSTSNTYQFPLNFVSSDAMWRQTSPRSLNTSFPTHHSPLFSSIYQPDLLHPIADNTLPNPLALDHNYDHTLSALATPSVQHVSASHFSSPTNIPLPYTEDDNSEVLLGLGLYDAPQPNETATDLMGHWAPPNPDNENSDAYQKSLDKPNLESIDDYLGTDGEFDDIIAVTDLLGDAVASPPHPLHANEHPSLLSSSAVEEDAGYWGSMLEANNSQFVPQHRQLMT